MPGAIIAIDQDRPGPTTSFGSPGVARNDLWVNNVVRPRCTTSNNTSLQWTLLDKPPGSAATLTGANTATPSFTPDLVGSYRLELVTNGGGSGNVQVLLCGVRYDASGVLLNRGWRNPALGETAAEANWSSRGWAYEWEFVMVDLLPAASGLRLGGKDVIGTAPGDGQAPIYNAGANRFEWGTPGGGLADNQVTNVKLADMAALTVKCRTQNSSGDPEDLAIGTAWHVVMRNGSNALVGALITNDNVSASAAIAGSKISPNFGAQNIENTGRSLLGAGTRSSTGLIAVSDNQVVLATRYTTGAYDIPLISVDANAQVTMGHTTTSGNFFSEWAGIVATRAGTGPIHNQVGGADKLTIASTKVTVNVGVLEIGSSGLAGAGNLRGPNDWTFYLRRFSEDNRIIKHINSQLTIGEPTAGYMDVEFAWGNSAMGFRYREGSYWLNLDGTNGTVELGKPLIGKESQSSPYGIHGKPADVAITGNHVVTAAQYKYGFQRYTGTPGAGFTVTYPNPASNADGYWKFVHNSTDSTMTFVCGTDSSQTLAAGGKVLAFFANNSVTLF